MQSILFRQGTIMLINPKKIGVSAVKIILIELVILAIIVVVLMSI